MGWRRSHGFFSLPAVLHRVLDVECMLPIRGCDAEGGRHEKVDSVRGLDSGTGGAGMGSGALGGPDRRRLQGARPVNGRVALANSNAGAVSEVIQPNSPRPVFGGRFGPASAFCECWFGATLGVGATAPHDTVPGGDRLRGH